MFDRIRRSFDLVHASARILRRDHHLMLFPVISGVTMMLVVAAFLLPIFGFKSIDGLGRSSLYSAAFLFYVVEYFVIFYFNAALVGAVMVRLDGGSPTLSDGLRIANSRFGAILGYAVIAATIGVILRGIQERVGFIGRLIVGVIGAGWAAATYLVVPVIVTRDQGAIGSISESATLLKRTWGENLVGQTGLGAAFGLVYFGLAGTIALLAIVLVPLAAALSPWLFVAAAVFVVLAVLACALMHATLSGIYSAVLYRYAVDGSGTAGFDTGMLGSAFQRKA
jgi:hypothetical protein